MLNRFARLASVVVLSSGVAYAEDKPKTSTAPQKEPTQKTAPAAPQQRPQAVKVENKPATPPARIEVKTNVVKVEVKAHVQPVKVETKAAPAKTEAKVAGFVPRELHGTPTAKRLTELQADIDAVFAARGPARAEADKARMAADQAQKKSDDLNSKLKWLEDEKSRILTNALDQNRESAQQRADSDASVKINRLEAQVRDLTARLETMAKQQRAEVAPTACKSCKEKDKKPAESVKK